MTRRVGRFTKYETAELTRMFDEGYSVYKICRNLNRSQKSIRNNLIRLGLIEGIITPIRNVSKEKNLNIEEKLGRKSLAFFWRFFILTFLSLLFVVEPGFNILEVILFNIFY